MKHFFIACVTTFCFPFITQSMDNKSTLNFQKNRSLIEMYPLKAATGSGIEILYDSVETKIDDVQVESKILPHKKFVYQDDLPLEMRRIIASYIPKDDQKYLNKKLLQAIEKQNFDDISTLVAMCMHYDHDFACLNEAIRHHDMFHVSDSVKLKYNNNRSAILKYLIFHGIDINAQFNGIHKHPHSVTFKDSPVHVAVKNRNISALTILIENKADVNLKNRSYETPLDTIVSYKNALVYPCDCWYTTTAYAAQRESLYTLGSILRAGGGYVNLTNEANLDEHDSFVFTENDQFDVSYCTVISHCTCCYVHPLTYAYLLGCGDNYIQIPSIINCYGSEINTSGCDQSVGICCITCRSCMCIAGLVTICLAFA